jgi:hypothetical protein
MGSGTSKTHVSPFPGGDATRLATLVRLLPSFLGSMSVHRIHVANPIFGLPGSVCQYSAGRRA